MTYPIYLPSQQIAFARQWVAGGRGQSPISYTISPQFPFPYIFHIPIEPPPPSFGHKAVLWNLANF